MNDLSAVDGGSAHPKDNVSVAPTNQQLLFMAISRHENAEQTSLYRERTDQTQTQKLPSFEHAEAESKHPGIKASVRKQTASPFENPMKDPDSGRKATAVTYAKKIQPHTSGKGGSRMPSQT